MNLRNGTLLQGGRYKIVRVLGQGGFGITYLAEQVMLGKSFAVKEFYMKDFNLRDDAGRVRVPSTGSAKLVEQYRRKFVKEARNMASLSHPNIMSVVDIFEENGTVYYVMPFLEGGSLSDYVKQHGAMSEPQALAMLKPIASALRYMHDQKHLCHYDVKPANVLLNATLQPVIIDFGIAKNYDSDGNETSSTPIGMSEGFAPIEQYQGQVQEFSPESDVYALGATLYFLLTGKKPPTAIDRVGGAELDFPAGCSPQVKQLVEQSMTIARKNRPTSAGIFLQETPQAIEVQAAPSQSVENEETIVVEVQPMPAPPLVVRDEVFTIGGVSFKMVEVEGGTFMMGATSEQGGDADSDEKPAHRVTLSSFLIGETEVTQALWKAVMGSNPSYFTGDLQRPVEQVSWDDCQKFIRELNRLTGKQFRLPTEAEWEYAARGGNKSRGYKYAGGNDIESVAWYDGNSGNWVFNRKTHPVAKKVPNELGLYDMSGNVWEWCQDWYEKDYYSSSPSSNPTGPSSGSNRVHRGGSWCDDARDCRVSCRGSWRGDNRNYDLGLRLAL